MLPSLFIKSLCPSCIKEFYLGDCRIMSGITSGKILKYPAKSIFSRINVEPLSGPSYTKELARRECPNCGYMLPFNIELAPSVSIIVIGDDLAGKTSYIAALIRQLEDGQWMTQEQYTSVSCLTQEIKREYDWIYEMNYQKKENKQAHAAISSPSAKYPIVYELSLSSSPHRPPQSFNIFLYDLPSSSHLSVEDRQWYSRCLLHASAMIFLITPESLPTIASSLPSFLRPSRQTEPGHLLHSILQLLKQRSDFKIAGKASRFPMAVTVSKSDLLRFVHSFNVDFLFSRDCTYSNETSLRDIEEGDKNVRELLAVSGNQSLVNAFQEISHVKFFAVSAVGHSPNTQGKSSHAEPCRCLDPMLWIFHKLGIISELKKE